MAIGSACTIMSRLVVAVRRLPVGGGCGAGKPGAPVSAEDAAARGGRRARWGRSSQSLLIGPLSLRLPLPLSASLSLPLSEYSHFLSLI